MEPSEWLPVVFAGLMGLAMLIYAVLDGYDLGVGILMRRGNDEQKDQMIASIGPFWDANETWLVLGIGILLVAFPVAHGIILTGLYLPVTFMLIGLILRGVAFDFRAKAEASHKHRWDMAFHYGSLLASLSQGFMLGQYIVGFHYTLTGIAFSLLIGLCVAAGYAMIGAAWLIMKTEGELQKRAVYWARVASWGTAFGIILVSLTTPMVSPRIFEKWFSLPNIFLLAPIPMITAAVFAVVEVMLRRLPAEGDKWCWAPFAGTVVVYILSFHGLAYSFFPYIVPDRLTIWEAASAPESLIFILVGTAIVLPAILTYTVFAYRVFWGKVRELRYY